MSVSDGISTIGSIGRQAAPLTFTAGFVWGATNDIIYGSGDTGATISQRVSDTIARVTGQQLTIPGSQKSTQTQRMSIGNILNYGTYGAIGLEIAHNMTSNKWVKLAKDVFQPPLAGYGIGKVFDDAVATSTALTQIGGSAYPVANYSSQARNGLIAGGPKSPWTGA